MIIISFSSNFYRFMPEALTALLTFGEKFKLLPFKRAPDNVCTLNGSATALILLLPPYQFILIIHSRVMW